MKLIQLILILPLFLLVALYLKRFRSLLMDRLIILALGMSGITLVVKPEWSSQLAGLVGVGRGVDLIMYLAFVGLGFISLILYTKLRQLEQRMTELARQGAIQHASRLPSGSPR